MGSAACLAALALFQPRPGPAALAHATCTVLPLQALRHGYGASVWEQNHHVNTLWMSSLLLPHALGISLGY